tara:strand:- start:1363 stop:1635 length:273 start_codon:yes stop_codon:yes gene_type:complete
MSIKRLIVVPKLYAGAFVYFSAHYHRDEDGEVYRYEVIESIEDRPFFTQEELDKVNPEEFDVVYEMGPPLRYVEAAKWEEIRREVLRGLD